MMINPAPDAPDALGAVPPGGPGDPGDPASRVGAAGQEHQSTVGTWRWDISTDHVEWDDGTAAIFGVAPGDFDGSYTAYRRLIHPDDAALMEAKLWAALESASVSFTDDHRIVLPDGSTRWCQVIGRIQRDPGGKAVGLVGMTLDVTRQRRVTSEAAAVRAAERRATAQAQAARRRVSMLARAAGLLDIPLDLDATLQEVADLAIGVLAEWCTVDLIGGGRVHHAAVAHREPAMVATARSVMERFPQDPDEPTLQHLLHTLEPLYVPVFDDEALEASVSDPEHLRMLRQFEISSYLVVPLVADGEGVGIMTLVACQGRRLEADDVDLAVELGRRAGSAVEKARLYSELRETTRVLQTTLMPPSLPEIPGVTLSAHYQSGTAGLDIGGDFYDVFRTGRDRWWIVLGDACGKGPAAAALTAEARYSLHVLAPDTDDPAQVLERLNEVLNAVDREGRFISMVLLTFVAPTGQESSAGTGLRLQLASAGHPPPLLRRCGGGVESLTSQGTVVGVLPQVDLESISVDLARGDTLLLYTDGATEARDADGHELGEATLREILRQHGGGPDLADRLAAAVLTRAGTEPQDDMALLTLAR
jgi:PAS domain S-box-containing protein